MRARPVVRIAGGLILSLLLAGCATAPSVLSPPPASNRIPLKAEARDVPFFPQERHQCGPAALASVLGWSGVAVTPETLSEQVYLAGKQGSFQSELMAASRRHGRIPYQIPPGMESLLDELAAGHPVLVLQNLGLAWYPRWHYAVVIAYDLDDQSFTLHSGLEARKAVPMQLFERTWTRAGHWSMVIMPPDQLPVTATEYGYLAAITGLERLGAWATALAAYQAALQRWPDSEYAMLGLANSHHRLGRLDEAEDIYRRALEAHPSSAVFHNNLAQIMLEQGRLKEAEDAARTAVTLGGNLADAYRRTLEAILEKRRKP